MFKKIAIVAVSLFGATAAQAGQQFNSILVNGILFNGQVFNGAVFNCLASNSPAANNVKDNAASPIQIVGVELPARSR